MYFTHHFAHPETLSRARSWLTRLGFHPHQVTAHTSGIHRLALAVAPGQADEIRMLINAVERTDPDGFPSFWEMARQPHAAPDPADEPDATPAESPHATVIGWHPPDRAPFDDPDVTAILDAMGRR